MATAREESNSYDGVAGVGGKLKKRPFRRTTKATPYDRPPPTSIRNPSGNGNNGWLSKLVDPARRLITSGAHRLFASVFTKSLTHPPPRTRQSLDSETNKEPMENQPEAISTVPPVVPGAIIGCENPINHTEGSGVADLEEILNQKTFTRSEIDRLTSLLHTRGADISGRNEEKKSELSLDNKEEFPKTPVRENVIEKHLISTPVVSSTVINEVVASTAELGKAYLGSRTPKVSVSRPGMQNQVRRGDLTFPSNKIFPSMSSTISLVPTSSVRAGSHGNNFVTPRSRGRSAIYSMARSPYSRVNSTTLLKSSGTASVAFGGLSSSSQTAWEQHRISGFRQGVLKRRSSLLDNDIGSVGPIRRVRQKSNLLSLRNLSSPASPGPLSAHVAGSSSAGLDSLPENRGNSTPDTSVTTVPSKSNQIASKILQHLDMVSPVEKSPTKLSLSMLHGKALKSLENVDSSKFLENMHDSDKLSGSCTALPGFHDSVSHKHDRIKENGSTMMVALHDKPIPAVNGADSNSLTRDNNMPSAKAADSSVIDSVLQQSQPKSCGFQMSAHEDYLELDDDDHPNGATPAEESGMLNNSVVGSKSATVEVKIEKPSSLSEVKPISSSAFNQKPDLRTADGLIVVEKKNVITSPVKEVATSSLQSAFPSTPTANKDDVSSHPNASYMLSIGEKNAAEKQSNDAVTTFGFASTNVGEVSSATGSSGVKLSTSSDKKLENLSSFATTAPGTTNNLSDKTSKDKKPEAAVTSSISTSTSAGSIFKFGDSTDGSTLNNGSLASSPFSFSSPTSALVPSYGQSSSRTTATISDSSTATTTSASATVNATVCRTTSPSVEASIPSFTAAPVFKFSSSGDQSTPGEVTKSKTQDTSLGNVGNFSFGCTSPFTSSGSSIFGCTSEVTNAVGRTTGTSAEAISSGNSSFSGISSTITNSGSGFSSSTFSTVTSTGNGIFGGTSATSSTGSGIFGGTSATASTGNGIFGGTTTSTGNGVFGGTTTSTGNGVFGGTTTSTGNAVFGDTSATTSTCNGVFGGTSATTSTGNGVFGGTSATTSTGNVIFGGTSATTSTGSSIFSGTSLPIAGTGSNIFGSTKSAITSTGSSIFGFSAPAVSTSTTSAAGTGIGTSTQSMPIQFFSSSPAFGSGGSTSFPTSSSMFGSSASVSEPFGSGPTFGTSSSETNSLSSNSGIASGTFGLNWQAPKTPVFGSSPSGFSFGSTSVSTPSSAPTIFGSSTGASSSSLFSFTSATVPPPSQPVFGNTSPGLVFGSTPSSNNNQMEDSMAEDTVQSSPTVTTFGQQPISPPASGFVFGAPNPPGAGSFQFRSQPSIAAPQNPSPFLASGSLEFGAGGGGSFSLGTSGGDKSARRTVKVRKQRKR